MQTPTADSSPATTRLTWIPLGLLAACVATVLRARMLAEIDVSLRRLEPALVEWRIAGALGGDLAIACMLFLGAALLARTLVGRHPGLTAAALIILVEVAYLTVVGGRWTAPFHRLDLIAGDRLWRHAALVGAAFAIGVPILLATLRARHAGRTARLLGPRTLGALALLTFVTPLLYGAIFAGDAPTMVVRQVRRDLLAGEASWAVVSEHPEAPAVTGILTPALDYRTDSVDLPSLLMAPPCEVRFTVGPQDGEVVLRAAAGVDRSVGDRPNAPPRAFGFAITRNSEVVFEAIIPDGRNIPNEERIWRRVTQEFSPGDELGLRTWVQGVSEDEASEAPPARIGFGRLVLEQREVRERQPASAGTPSILFIVQDTLRADRLSCYGYDKLTTPNLDALADRGVRYSQAYSTSSWTWPATASLLTGLVPEAHGVTDDDSCYLSSRNETLAEALQKRGYTTAAFTANPLIVPQRNFDQGFEHFSNKRNHPFRKSDAVMPEVLDWLEVHAGTRFFLYLHLVDSHAPHEPRPEDLARLGGAPPAGYAGDAELHDLRDALLKNAGRDRTGSLHDDALPAGYLDWWNDVYDASTATGDHYIGQLLERLEHLGLSDDTIIVFTSDHGEEWLDHGHLTHGQHVHTELVKVPLILAGPGIPAGVVNSTPVSNRHLAPTLASFGGADLPGVPDPLSLVNLSGATEPLTFSTEHGWWNGRQRQPLYGIRDGRFVLHLAPEGGDWGVIKDDAPASGQWRLYDVEADPGETSDIAAEHPEEVERLRHEILARLERALAARPDARFGAGAETMQILEQFGYAGGESEEDD